MKDAHRLTFEKHLSAWLDERAVRDGTQFTSGSELFSSWSAWARNVGAYIQSRRWFSQELERQGFIRHRHSQLGRGFIGIKLKEAPQ